MGSSPVKVCDVCGADTSIVVCVPGPTFLSIIRYFDAQLSEGQVTVAVFCVMLLIVCEVTLGQMLPDMVPLPVAD